MYSAAVSKSKKDFDSIKMHGTTMKIIDTQQAKLCNSCKNTKLKLLKTKAAIWFNKMCKIKHLKPNCINIKINGKKLQDNKSTNNAVKYRINHEIKFLYSKKQNLIQQLYLILLKCAQYCNGMWQHIQNSVNLRLNDFMDALYQKLNKNTTYT
jgi:ribosomal protein L37AE/L43A